MLRENICLTWYQRIHPEPNISSLFSSSLFSSLLLNLDSFNLSPHERAYGVTNIKSHIPIILDDDEHNYDAWKELSLTHCQTFEVSGHLDGTLLPADDDDAEWRKKDGLVKLWLYITLSKSLFKSTFKTGGTSREIWLQIENYFRNNKEAKAIQLDHDLRNKVIGDKSIQVYCQELSR